MKRTDADEHTGNLFQDTNLPTTAGTLIDAEWLNDVQEEICNVVETLGIAPLDGADDEQMSKALRFMMRQASALDYWLVETDGTDDYKSIASSGSSSVVIMVGDAGRIRYVDSDGPASVTSGTTADLVGIDADATGAVYGAIGNTATDVVTRKGTASGTTWAASTTLFTGSTAIGTGIAKAVGFGGAKTWLAVGYNVGDSNGWYAEGDTDLAAGAFSAAVEPAGANGKPIRAVAFKTGSSGEMLVVGDDGYIATHMMGSTHTQRTSGTTENLLAAAWWAFGGVWVVVGDNGTVLTSPDAVAWTARTNPTGIATDDFMAVDAAGESVAVLQTTGVLWCGSPLSSNWKNSKEMGVTPAGDVHLAGGRRYYLGGPGGRVYRSRSF